MLLSEFIEDRKEYINERIYFSDIPFDADMESDVDGEEIYNKTTKLE